MSEQGGEKDARPACDCALDCAERIECKRAGEVGHFACGWCEVHQQARHVGPCFLTCPPAPDHAADAPTTQPAKAPHSCAHPT